MQIDDTPFDLRQYLAKLQSLENNCLVPMKNLIPTIKEFWDGNPYTELLASVPWLAGFTTVKGDLGPARSALSRNANRCTRFILRLDVFLANETIMPMWRELTRFRFGDGSTGSSVSAEIQHQIEETNGTIQLLWKQLQWSSEDYTKQEVFQTFSSKVADICLEAGCPLVQHQPSNDIYSLRKHLFTHDAAVREAELRKELEAERLLNRVQQRIITNLTFRHLLEKLPPPSATATSAWDAFFRTAVHNAQQKRKQGRTDHPLISVLNKYQRVGQIEAVGKNFYGTLSTNIHHFSTQFEVLDDQWNMLEADILRAITPLAENQGETGTDWAKERLRY